ncbi:uncharacterized protein dbf4b [Archocentrus centrarchus]|uniref:uncharacterized protein dbf4b n=1 Tax=Archocentrus centrarchus TaxID=63155 RepID=UPI0011E9BD36|nr:uncharacterized protein LOC115798609 [Archocentrus centrarchus]
MQPQQHLKERGYGLLGKLSHGAKKLEGRTFYLDNVKKQPTALLLEAISLLGGRVESFLHKDVNFVVTGNKEGLKEKDVDNKGVAKGPNEATQHLIKQRESGLGNDKRRPRPMACGSRGKALLEKAIRNNERLQGSSVLSSAQSWGVKILHVDDVLRYLKYLTRESFSSKHKRAEKTGTKYQGSPVVKALALRSPYLKIEDLSRKYKPLHMQSMTFPDLYYSGRFSPFESPPPQFEMETELEGKKTRAKTVKSSIQEKSQSKSPLSCNPSRWRPRKKDASYCECCHQSFTNLEEHLQSDQHRTFVLDPSNYSLVDQLMVEMLPEFDPSAPQQSEETLSRPPTPLPIHDVCELEPLSDAEMEHAVQALRRQSSSLNIHISSPTRGPLSCPGPASPSPGVQFTIPNPGTQPADTQSFSHETDCQLPDIHPQASSPAIPVLKAEVEAQDSVNQLPEIQHLSPCPLSDPFSLPPVLSPQVPYSYIINPQSPYSDPPVLSPQPYTTDEPAEGQTEDVFKLVSALTDVLSTPQITSVAVTNAEGPKGSKEDGLVGFAGLACSNRDLECATLSSGRSRSLPRQSDIAANPKKRCRSASPECSRSKRTRTAKTGNSISWTGENTTPAKSQSDSMAKTERSLFSDKAPYEIIQSCLKPNVSSTFSTCTLDIFGFKQAYRTFCFPVAQNFTRASAKIDSIPNQPLEFPADKFHSTFSSQESQRSLSHSTSICIEPGLIPDLAKLSPSSSESDWDCDLLSQVGPTSATPLTSTEQNCELDKELLHRPCPWMHDTSYESHLHTVLQPAPPPASLCGEERDAFSRTVVQIVEVQH